MMFFDIEGRQDAHDVFTGRDGQQPVMIARVRYKSATVDLQLYAKHQPDPTHAVE